VLEQSLAIFKETLMGLMDEDRKVLKMPKAALKPESIHQTT
jgi:hypothetical protein